MPVAFFPPGSPVSLESGIAFVAEVSLSYVGLFHTDAHYIQCAMNLLLTRCVKLRPCYHSFCSQP